MVKKGNLIWNGDFERGNVDGWTKTPKKAGYEKATIEINDAEKRTGNYCAKLTLPKASGYSYIGWDDIFDFEEYEAYLIELATKKGTNYGDYARIEFYDGSGNIIEVFLMEEYADTTYGLTRGIIGNFGLANGFSLFIGGYATAANQIMYADDIFLRGLKSKHSIAYTLRKDHGAKTATFTYMPNITIGFPIKLRSRVRISDIGGTSPTLDIRLRLAELVSGCIYDYKDYPQITANGDYYLDWDSTGFGIFDIKYTIGGTSPTFTILHNLSIAID